MAKTVIQALMDEIIYPIPYGKVENIVIKRDMKGDEDYTSAVAKTISYKGALADCLYSLLHAINFSEADKSVGALTDAQRKSVLTRANGLYKEIGEPEVEDPQAPKVYVNCDPL